MGPTGWGLQVVRGREVGRVYPVGPGSSVLGNALNGQAGIDLSTEEGTSPRKMAGRQARLDLADEALTLHDLDSPGGTFVNRERLLSGKGRPLRAGDIIQVGGVQLKVVASGASAPAPPTAPPPPTTAAPARGGGFRLPDGTNCQTWDDFLAASSKNWAGLRGELTSGRLGEHVIGLGRRDLLPKPPTPGLTDDDRLDDWLGRLPTTRPAVTAMEVHPLVLRARAVGGGGVARVSFRVTNTGYRLLRNSLRLEPSGQGWVAIAPAFAGGPFATAEETEIPIELTLPAELASPRETGLWVEGNAGRRRVEIRLEPSAATPPVPGAPLAAPSPSAIPGESALAGFTGLPTAARVIPLALLGVVLRGLVAGGDVLSGQFNLGEVDAPALGGTAAILAGLGALAGGRMALRRGEATDLPPSAFAGALGGVILAAVAVAACRSVEPLLGPLGSRTLPACLVWGVLGAAVGWGIGVFRQGGPTTARPQESRA